VISAVEISLFPLGNELKQSLVSILYRSSFNGLTNQYVSAVFRLFRSLSSAIELSASVSLFTRISHQKVRTFEVNSTKTNNLRHTICVLVRH